MKVKVFSAIKEVRAMTGRTWDKDGNLSQIFRDFRPKTPKSHHGECYMTPEEAEFLVESPENQMRAAQGSAHFSYPTGFPVPVPEDKDGFFAPPLDDKATQGLDERQLSAAAKVKAEREQAMQRAQAEHDAQFAEGNVESSQAPARGSGRKNKPSEESA